MLFYHSLNLLIGLSNDYVVECLLHSMCFPVMETWPQFDG